MLDDIKLTHRATPLRVFLNGKPVPISKINDVMEGAVVEIQFELLHFPIGAQKKHSFNACVQQIQILQPGENRPATAFKRKSIDEGPFQLHDSSDESREGSPETLLAQKRQRSKTNYYTVFWN